MDARAMWPDRVTGRIRRSALGLLVALMFAGACIEGELGKSSVETKFGTMLTLTADHPVVTRSLDYMAEPGAKPVLGVDGHIQVVGVGEPFFHPDVWLSILNLETGDSVDHSDGIGSASVDGGSHHAPCDGKPVLDAGELRDLPVPPCRARWTVIARWLDAEPGVEIPLELNASMLAHATELYPEGDPFTLDALAVTDAGIPLPIDGPAVTRRTYRGSTTFTSTSGRETHRYLLRVPAALVDDAGSGLRLGRIFVGIGLKERSQPMSMRTELTIDDEVVASATAPISMERDWLARCAPGSACELPIMVTFEPKSSSEVATMSPDGVVAFDWTTEARLEDFGEGATMPAELELIER
jgi:hypothetical protein